MSKNIANLKEALEEKTSSLETIKSSLEQQLRETSQKVYYTSFNKSIIYYIANIIKNFLFLEMENFKNNGEKSEEEIRKMQEEKLDLINQISDGQLMAKQLTKQIQGYLSYS